MTNPKGFAGGGQGWLVVVPARLASTRLPNKPLQTIRELPLVVKVYNRLRGLRDAGADVVVALDSSEVAAVCDSHGIPWRMTSVSHRTGSERCQEVAAASSHPYILNVQGDEPFISLADLRSLMAAMEGDPALAMATLGYRSVDRVDYANPNVVKIVINAAGDALYFSRSPIPYYRQESEPFGFIQHQGVYAFTRQGLARFHASAPSPLEAAESLEQLRALECGMRIKVIMAKERSFGIDTPEDLARAQRHPDA